VNASQLCHAVVDLILQMTSWTTPIQDLIQKLEPRNEQDNYHLRVVLEVLAELSENFLKRTRGLDARRQSELLKLFAASSEDILRFLVVPHSAYYLNRI
jgi:hypothetical protein